MDFLSNYIVSLYGNIDIKIDQKHKCTLPCKNGVLDRKCRNILMSLSSFLLCNIKCSYQFRKDVVIVC